MLLHAPPTGIEAAYRSTGLSGNPPSTASSGATLPDRAARPQLDGNRQYPRSKAPAKIGRGFRRTNVHKSCLCRDKQRPATCYGQTVPISATNGSMSRQSTVPLASASLLAYWQVGVPGANMPSQAACELIAATK